MELTSNTPLKDEEFEIFTYKDEEFTGQWGFDEKEGEWNFYFADNVFDSNGPFTNIFKMKSLKTDEISSEDLVFYTGNMLIHYLKSRKRGEYIARCDFKPAK